MTITSFWNTLATDDLERARAFYSALGFAVKDMPPGAGGISVHPAEGALICLFPTDAFRKMAPTEVCDTKAAHELIQSISVDTKEGVDALAEKAKRAGGELIGEPKEQPFGYACGFADPDGHVWSVLWLAS